jgi:hypothetical protein
LRVLVAAVRQDHDFRPAMREIDAVTWTMGDPHFHNAAADALGVARIPQLHARDASNDPSDRIGILEAVQPVRKLCRLAQLDHAAAL